MKKIILILAMFFTISAISQTTFTASTTQTIVKVDSLVSMTPELFDISALATKTGTVANVTIRLYVNSVPYFDGNEQLFAAAITNYNFQFTPFRRLVYYSGTNFVTVNKTNLTLYDYGSTSQVKEVTPVNLNSKKYIIMSLQSNYNTSEVFTIEYFKIRKL